MPPTSSVQCSCCYTSYIFGGNRRWQNKDWVTVDDRVRGGKSQSHLKCLGSSDKWSSQAIFSGNLDITALGGAGFASQRTSDPRHWDLSPYQGLRLILGAGDAKKYTLILKDEVKPKRPDGREQSTVSWEYDFTGKAGELVISWDEFKPTYRGKPKPDAKPLDLRNIRRISFMMRSFFGTQEGPFSLEIDSLEGIEREEESRASTPDSLVKGDAVTTKKSRWSDWFCGIFPSRN